MRTIQLIYVLGMILGGTSSLFAYQSGLDVTAWSSDVETTGDSCRPNLRGITRATSGIPGNLEAWIYIALSATGPDNFSFTIHPTSELGGPNDRTVTLNRMWPLNLDYFGIYSITLSSIHYGRQGSNRTIDFTFDTASAINIECEYFTNDDDEENDWDDAHCHGGNGDNDLGCTSPIVIDLDRNGFHFGQAGTGVYFDLLGNGQPLYIQWVRSDEDDAFLFLDANGNGLVDDGSELFGNGTRLLLKDNELAPNGFVGLAQYDHPDLGGDDNGLITQEDAVWEGLYLWLDTNANGISEPPETLSLSDYGLYQLEIIPRETKRYDRADNWLRFFADAKNTRNHKHKMVDVFFRHLE